MADPSQQIDPLLRQAKSLYNAGALKDSNAICRQILALDLTNAEATHLMGLLALRTGKLEMAEDLLRIAISFDRTVPNYCCNLAQYLLATSRMEDALEFCDRALSIDPNDFESLFTAGKVLRSARQLPAAIAAFDKAIRIRPDSTAAHANLGITQLFGGDFENGWREYEMRGFPQRFSQPRWDGSPLNGKRVLVYTEQDADDAIHFCRYIPLIAERGGKTALLCQPELVRLCKNVRGIEQISTDSTALPDFDLHCPIASLPFVFKSTLQNIPSHVPYLVSDNPDIEKWQLRIQGTSGAGIRNIGLACANIPKNRIVGSRIISLEMLAASLFNIPRTQYFNLTKNGILKDPAAGEPVPWIDWTSELVDLADVAALIQGMDLVITADSIIAHLAGALGRPVWLLLGYVPDWRWMLDRNDSPWYPTMELFRQPKVDDWETPLSQISNRLQESAL